MANINNFVRAVVLRLQKNLVSNVISTEHLIKFVHNAFEPDDIPNIIFYSEMNSKKGVGTEKMFSGQSLLVSGILEKHLKFPANSKTIMKNDEDHNEFVLSKTC